VNFSILLVFLLGYLVGSTPIAYLLSKRKGGNIFQQGSGNPGATNTLTVYGKKAAATVLVLDVMKGFLPTLLILLLTEDRTLAFWTGTGAVLGHVASLYTGFRGGKALATAGGVLLCLFPIPLAIVIVAYVLLLLLIRYIVIATTLVILGAVVFFLFFAEQPLSDQLALLTMVAGILYRHLANWERVFLGNEPKIGDNVSELTLERLKPEGQRRLRLFYWSGIGLVYALVIFAQT
jgi:glycerol-3-phosphate acyltransferase PlsY